MQNRLTYAPRMFDPPAASSLALASTRSGGLPPDGPDDMPPPAPRRLARRLIALPILFALGIALGALMPSRTHPAVAQTPPGSCVPATFAAFAPCVSIVRGIFPATECAGYVARARVVLCDPNPNGHLLLRLLGAGTTFSQWVPVSSSPYEYVSPVLLFAPHTMFIEPADLTIECVTVTMDESGLLDRLLMLLSERRVRYCVIDGQAVNAFVEPLVSLDLDLAVAASDLGAIEELLGAQLKVRRFAHSLIVSQPDSALRVQIQLDPRYADFPSRARERDVLGRIMPVAAVEDVLAGKVWALEDTTGRASKRQKDLADIARLLEAFPELRPLVPQEVLSQLL